MTVPGPSPLKRILFATDFSPCSEAVMTYAAALARDFDATLYAAHVIPTESLGLEPPVYDQLRAGSVQQMNDLEDSEALQGTHFVPLIAEGDVGTNIAELTRQNRIDLIVVGTHGRTGIRKFVMGSVAEDIFRHAVCPVIALGPQVCADARRTASLRRVLHATDFGHDASARFVHALSLLEDKIEKLTLMHVLTTPPVTDDETAKTIFRNNLLSLVPMDTSLSNRPEAVVEVGHPAELIVQVAKERQIDLIVLGVHPPGLMASHLMDTAYKVMIEAPCPVMLVSAARAAAQA
jgi:nucleotide-binding universal stress UspA family protein